MHSSLRSIEHRSSSTTVARVRAAGIVLLVLAAMTCAGTFIYSAHIPVRESRRSNAFLIGMGVPGWRFR